MGGGVHVGLPESIIIIICRHGTYSDRDECRQVGFISCSFLQSSHVFFLFGNAFASFLILLINPFFSFSKLFCPPGLQCCGWASLLNSQRRGGGLHIIISVNDQFNFILNNKYYQRTVIDLIRLHSARRTWLGATG